MCIIHIKANVNAHKPKRQRCYGMGLKMSAQLCCIYDFDNNNKKLTHTSNVGGVYFDSIKLTVKLATK